MKIRQWTPKDKSEVNYIIIFSKTVTLNILVSGYFNYESMFSFNVIRDPVLDRRFATLKNEVFETVMKDARGNTIDAFEKCLLVDVTNKQDIISIAAIGTR